MPSDDLAESPNLRIRPTMLSDLDFVVSVEQDEKNLPFITPWERTQHEGAIRFPDSRHFIVEAGQDWERVGFVILQGCRNPMQSIELKRIVLQTRVHGRGLGAAALQWIEDRAREARCARLRLRVNKSNALAIRAYQRAGFAFVEDICTDIGGGFFMDDYVMEKPVT